MKNNSRKRSRMILLLIIIFVLLTGAGTAYANKSALINSYYRNLKSPREYYTYLEKYGLYKLVSSLPEDVTAGNDPYAFDISSNITFHRNKLDSILDTEFGANLTDLEKHLGISLSNIGLDLLFVSKDNMRNKAIGLKLNDTPLLTTELFFDSEAQRMLLRSPELSEAYLTKSLREEDINRVYELQQKLLNTDLPQRILRRYIELYFNHLGSVTLEQRVNLTLDSTDIECDLITVSFTPEEFRELCLYLLDAVKSDEDILSLLPLINITQEQYLQSLNKIENIIFRRYSEENFESILQLKLYVNNKGEILGREMTTFNRANLGYTLLVKEDYLEYELHLTNTSTNPMLYINGINRRIEEDNQGKISLNIKNPGHSSDDDINIDITYEGVRSLSYEGQSYLEGNLTLSSNILAGIMITSDFSYNENSQLNTTAIRLGTSPLVDIKSKGKSLTDYEIIQPSASGPRYDLLEYKKYLSGINFEDYLTSLSKSLGLSREALMDLLW